MQFSSLSNSVVAIERLFHLGFSVSGLCFGLACILAFCPWDFMRTPSTKPISRSLTDENGRHIFYLPFYFQAVKGTSAQESGIRTIPYLASIIVSSIIVGVSITVLGPYKPFMIFGGAIFTVGAGLLYTLQVSSSAGKWIGYQLLAGFGAGAGKF